MTTSENTILKILYLEVTFVCFLQQLYIHFGFGNRHLAELHIHKKQKKGGVVKGVLREQRKGTSYLQKKRLPYTVIFIVHKRKSMYLNQGYFLMVGSYLYPYNKQTAMAQ